MKLLISTQKSLIKQVYSYCIFSPLNSNLLQKTPKPPKNNLLAVEVASDEEDDDRSSAEEDDVMDGTDAMGRLFIDEENGFDAEEGSDEEFLLDDDTDGESYLEWKFSEDYANIKNSEEISVSKNTDINPAFYVETCKKWKDQMDNIFFDDAKNVSNFVL